MSDLYLWGAAIVAFLVSIAGAWFGGHSKGKAVAETKAAQEKVEAVTAAAERQTVVTKEAAHVDQKVAVSSDADIDKQLSDKWTRRG